MKALIEKQRNNIYVVILLINFLMMDFVIRNIFSKYAFWGTLNKVTILFVIGWSLSLTGICCILPGKIKKAVSIIIVSIFSCLMIVHNAYDNVFQKFFSVSDFSLINEGTEFMDMSYIHVRKIVIIVALWTVVSTIVSLLFCYNEKKNEHLVLGIIMIILGVGSTYAAKFALPERASADTWNANSNLGNIYDDFVDTHSALVLTGLYEYTFRDCFLTFNSVKLVHDQEAVEELNEYFEAQEEHQKNSVTGMFEGKNLILIQLENIDNWMLTEENMPNLYQLRDEGIDFVNHYSPAFATGKTFNTEFIVNTGFVPMTKGEAPGYIYSKNAYPYSLANIFKNSGYSVNSYHSARGSIYNRENSHKNFGYEKYHNYVDMGMDDYTMDSQLTNNFECMVTSEKFFDFIITYSGHGPFSIDNAACAAHIEEVKEESESEDETYLNGLAQAKETDLFVKNLIMNLDMEGLLDDTVLIFYSDHYAYSTISEELQTELKGTSDENLLQNTPFFIWASDITSKKVEKVTNTADILPTIANFFNLETDYRYYVGEDIFDESYTGYAMFSDFSWYNGEYYYRANEENPDTEMQELTSIINQKIRNSWKTLEVDYFYNK